MGIRSAGWNRNHGDGERGVRGYVVRKEAWELLTPYITGLSGERAQSTCQCDANILCRHHVLDIEEAR